MRHFCKRARLLGDASDPSSNATLNGADTTRNGCRSSGGGVSKATSNTVMEYIQRVRIEAAKKALESGRKTVNEVMFDVGYSDAKAFREVFKKMAGMSPVDYRSKYNRSAAVA